MKDAIMKGILLSNFFAVVLFFLAFPYAGGATTNTWTQSTESEFDKGTKQNISVRDTGEVCLSQKMEPIRGIESAFVWSMAVDAQNQVFVGTGDPGTVYLIKNGSEAVEVLKSPELYIQSLAADKQGNIYAGTAPRGIIYKISTTGKATIFCSLPAPYIWGMAVDSDSHLIVATGNEGILYKISPDGVPAVFFDSPETNLLDIVLDQDNNVFVGTEPHGLIYKITPSGQAFVIYDASESEIHCLAMDSLGNIYAGTASGAQTQIPGVPAAQPPPMQSEVVTPLFKEGETWDLNLPEASSLVHARTISQHRPVPKDVARTAQVKSMPNVPNYIYKIAGDGLTQKIFETDKAFILGLSLDTKNNLYVVTGNEPGVYKVFENETVSSLVDMDEVQVLCCLNTPDNELYVGTGNVGKVYKIFPFFEEEGTFISQVFDTTVLSDWGCITWEGTQPEGTKITLATRSGNCENPDTTWGNWSAFYTMPGERIASSASRFLQYKARMQTTHADVTPALNAVSLSYLPKNQPPNIVIFELEKEPSVTSKKPSDTKPDSKVDSKVQTHSIQKQHHQIAQKNIKWEVEDPNDDTLQVTIYYKGVDEKAWKVIDRNIQKKGGYAWDTLRLPDGKYQIKMVVSDSSDNPPETAFDVENILQPMVIDNSRPAFRSVNTTSKGEGIYVISGAVKDDYSNIIRVQYTLDGQEWISASPVDGVFDSFDESFQITIKQIPPGDYTIVVNAFDSEGNIGAEKVLLEVK